MFAHLLFTVFSINSKIVDVFPIDSLPSFSGCYSVTEGVFGVCSEGDELFITGIA